MIIRDSGLLAYFFGHPVEKNCFINTVNVDCMMQPKNINSRAAARPSIFFGATPWNVDTSNVLMSGKICFFKSLLKRRDSTAGSRNRRNESGSELQTIGPATEKARVPNVLRRNCGIFSLDYNVTALFGPHNLLQSS